MTVHLCEGPDLSQVHILSVSQGNDLIKGKDEVKGVVQDILFIQSLTVLWDLGREEEEEEGDVEGELEVDKREREDENQKL